MHTLDPCLSPADADAVRRAIEAAAPFRAYVSEAQAEGVGRGLLRRHDAAMNHFTSMVRAGRAEPLDVLFNRSNLLRLTLVQPEGDEPAVHVPGVDALFRSPACLEAAAALTDRPVVEPLMLYANLMVPGQELPLHTDTPTFAGLNQTNTPEWLLVVMGHSKLFEPSRLPMLGAVTFFGGCDGGELVIFADGPDAPPTRVRPRDNTAVVFDAEAHFHGVSRVGGPDAAPPTHDVEDGARREADGRWRLGADGVFEDADIRFSVQWRVQCRPGPDDPAPPVLTRDAAIARLVEDMRGRGVFGDRTAALIARSGRIVTAR
jgi:hypothetical protein